MDIGDIRAERDVLQREIVRLVGEFEAATCVEVGAIKLDRETDYEAGLGKPVVSVVVEL